MCGIIAAVGERDVVPILLDGLRRLEYRGYDSAGIATIHGQGFALTRAAGKIEKLAAKVAQDKLTGNIGISHTRWATHGEPSEINAHPHLIKQRIAVVHNGIIENYQELKAKIPEIELQSETDSEVIAAYIYSKLALGMNLITAVQTSVKDFIGAYAICVIDNQDPATMVIARSGSPLAIGIGLLENFVASDPMALQKVTNEFIYLEENDIAEIRRDSINIYNQGIQVTRDVVTKEIHQDISDKGTYRHFMLKEIFEQPESISAALRGKIHNLHLFTEAFGRNAEEIFSKTNFVQIVACGTSYYAGLVARNWLEDVANVACNVEIASEYRYKKRILPPGTLLVTISQSGETADTIAALKHSKMKDQNICGTLSICNVPESTLVRESDLCLLTHAGPEIGVASTKAFTTQLTVLLLLSLEIARKRQMLDDKIVNYLQAIQQLPALVQRLLAKDLELKKISKMFVNRQSAIFLGRGICFPIALEGALKLKELSYIHAEAFPAGELKHGPLALVDDTLPVVVLAPNDDLLGKVKSNIQEVQARGGELLIITSPSAGITPSKNTKVILIEDIAEWLVPIAYTIPLQLLAYHVAVNKGTDVDQPRNLAKSVTVE